MTGAFQVTLEKTQGLVLQILGLDRCESGDPFRAGEARDRQILTTYLAAILPA